MTAHPATNDIQVPERARHSFSPGQTIPSSPIDGRGVKVAIILWSGLYGGAETWSLGLAKALVGRGVGCGLVVVGTDGPILEQAKEFSLTSVRLGLARGSHVLSRPRQLAEAVSSVSSQVAIVPSSGYLSAVLRLGGFKGKIIAVEHGCLLQTPGLPWARRAIRLIDRWSGTWAVDVQVAPSNFMMERLLEHRHSNIVRRIRLGLDTGASRNVSRAGAMRRGDVPTVIGFAGRLIGGKGLDVLVKACAMLDRTLPIRLLVAGDGPERTRLEAMVQSLRMSDMVTFRGWVADMPAFWKSCDLAVVPSDGWIESFGMVAVEAMACGLPVVASKQGGLAEIVVDGRTGRLFEPGDWAELTGILDGYLRNHDLRIQHGLAGRELCASQYDIERCAGEYLALIRELGA